MKARYVLLAVLLAAPVPALAGGPAPMSDDYPQAGRRGPPDGPMGQGGGMRSPERMFDRIDANHDGSVSRPEFMAAHRRMMEHRQERRGDDGPPGGGRRR